MKEASEAVRLQQLNTWAGEKISQLLNSSIELLDIKKASDDASFRRYFRASLGDKSFIIMDSPPDLEDCQPFVQVGQLMEKNGVNVPEIHAVDLEQGFMLLSDFGHTDYLSVLSKSADMGKVDHLYQDAQKALIEIQKIDRIENLPEYDRATLMREMNLFREWFLPELLDITLSSEETLLLDNLFDHLVQNALDQPVVLVHRDFHSRNLMYLKKNGNNPGILDFQDAVQGPITYDLVSLLKDCYIRWSDDYIYKTVQIYQERLVDAGLLDSNLTKACFERWFDLMGLQRHIKVAGIFSRLKFRDGKDRYLQDIPLVVQYIRLMLKKYVEFSEYSAWFNERLLPQMRNKGLAIL